MAISASQVQTSDTLETFRQEFNKLRTDVNGLDSGTISVANFTVNSADFANDGFKVTFDAVDLTGNQTLTAPDVTGTIVSTGNADAGATTTSASDVDHILVSDGGVLKKISRSDIGIGGAAYDDISAGDAAVNVATTSGNITIDAQGNDTDIIFKGTDGGSDTTFLTIDGSEGGLATFNDSIKIKDAGTIGNATHADVITLASTGVVTFKDDIVIKDAGTIGVASDTDAIEIAATGIVNFSAGATITSNTIKTAGKETLWVPVAAMKPTVSNGCSNHTEIETTSGNPDIQVLDFDAGSVATADVNGATSSTTALVVDGNSGTIVVGMIVTGSGISGTVTVATVTDQNNLVLSSAQSLSNNVSLTFTEPDEAAQFQISFPKSWNEGTITYQAYWTTSASDTDGVAWSLEGVAVSDNDTINATYGTAVVVQDDALGATNDLCVSAESSALTIAGTPAVGDVCFFKISRDHDNVNDDMAEDARLIGLKLFYTTNATNDA
tara:strand:+ start:1267 stop:2754 length:1488 start_codon:yes stop_codon:yes gene_type:complete